MKYYYVDVETTGLEAKKCDIIQISYIIEDRNIVKDSGTVTMQPVDYSTIQTKALEVNGMSIEKIKTFQPARDGHLEYLEPLCRYIDQDDPKDQYTIVAYNAAFDSEFIRQNFWKNGNKHFGRLFDYRAVDPMNIVLYLWRRGELPGLENIKLKTVCAYLNIPLENAHNAKSDVTALYNLFHWLNKNIKLDYSKQVV